jgi:hypothetical protein
MKRHHMIVVAAVLLGCATANAGPDMSATRDLVEDRHGVMIRTSSDPGAQSSLPMDLDAAYAALGLAYQRFGIDIAMRDPGAHSLGNVHLTVRGTLHGRALSTYFACGSDVTGEPLANARRLTISVVSTLSVVDAATTRVTTVVSGEATSSGTSTTAAHCSSTGRLEQDLMTEAAK